MGDKTISRRRTHQSLALESALALFLLSAAGGLWIAHGQEAAWLKFGMIAGGLALYGVVVQIPERVDVGSRGRFYPLHLMLSILPVAVTICFLLTNDWTRWVEKLPQLDQVVQRLAVWRLNWSYSLNPNVAGGIISVLLPLQITASRGTGRILGFTWTRILLIAVSALGLLMSVTRGAWLALILVAMAWGMWRMNSWLTRRWNAGRVERMPWPKWIPALVVSALGGIAILIALLGGDRLQALVVADRMPVWRSALDLVTDYPFTGLGLGNFQMADSAYVLLLHVGHTFHAHNLFLDLWLEQGLLGLLAFLWLLIGAASLDVRASDWRPSAWASLGVLLLHGLVDDPLYGDGGLAILVVFIPFALLARPTESALSTMTKAPTRRAHPALLAGIPVALIFAILLIPSVRAAFEANLGTLAQTRAELSIYSWPAWPIQDEVRRSPDVNLSPAIVHYQTALVLDPANATANRRLGQIELSLGQYEAACHHMERAYRSAPGQRATRQLLGECYAITGEIARAAELWRTVDVSQSQLVLRQWWYEHLGDTQRAAWIHQAATLTTN